MTKFLTLSERDRILLLDAIERARNSWRTCAPYLHVLRERVLTARVVPQEELSDDCVMMGDRARLLHARPAYRETVRLVFPHAHVPGEGTVSVISPLGAELLGAQAGQTVQWFTDDGPRQLIVEEVARRGARDNRAAREEPQVSRDPASAELRYRALSNLASTCPE
jgi:regulator of nucleoside diphosphate kinase